MIGVSRTVEPDGTVVGQYRKWSRGGLQTRRIAPATPLKPHERLWRPLRARGLYL